MADHSHPTASRKVLVAVGGQAIDAETVRLASRMTDPHGGKLYAVHIIEVNRSLPLGAVLDDVVERGEKILDEVEQLVAQSQLPVETELVQARDTGPAIVDEAAEWGADLCAEAGAPPVTVVLIRRHQSPLAKPATRET